MSDYTRKSKPGSRDERKHVKGNRGAKQCPRCKSNSLINGGCSCGYGKKELDVDIEGLNQVAEIATFGLALATMAVRNKKKMGDERMIDLLEIEDTVEFFKRVGMREQELNKLYKTNPVTFLINE